MTNMLILTTCTAFLEAVTVCFVFWGHFIAAAFKIRRECPPGTNETQIEAWYTALFHPKLVKESTWMGRILAAIMFLVLIVSIILYNAGDPEKQRLALWMMRGLMATGFVNILMNVLVESLVYTMPSIWTCKAAEGLRKKGLTGGRAAQLLIVVLSSFMTGFFISR